MIRLENVSVAFGGNKVLNNFSFVFENAKSYMIFAPSGKGKTTLLNAILSLIKYDGKVETDGKIAVLFQEDRLFPNLSVFENCKLVLEDSVKIEEILNVLKELKLQKEAILYPDEISGGMARRVSLARCLLYSKYANAIILDEPFKGLDEKLKLEVIEVIKKYSKGKTLIFVSHGIKDAILLNAEIVNL